jgi:hypothetical protein
VRFVPSFTAENAAPPTKATLVSLTMPLSTFLGLADQPGRLDGYGPVAAGLARLIAADAARDQPAWTTWRCIVTDDVHGTVLGVTDPVWTPRHDPPEKLARLVTAMEPVCVFPGCRVPARTRTANRCDLDHRIPYNPDDPDGSRPGPDRGGRTCSCNLQPLCRTHHQQKTSGALHVRAIHPRVQPAAPPAAPLGTLEWTLPSGVTVRSHPHIAHPATLVDLAAAAGGDIAADIAAAVQHITDRETRWTTHDTTRGPRHEIVADEEWADTAWQNSHEQATRARADIKTPAAADEEPCPF